MESVVQFTNVRLPLLQIVYNIHILCVFGVFYDWTLLYTIIWWYLHLLLLSSDSRLLFSDYIYCVSMCVCSCPFPFLTGIGSTLELKKKKIRETNRAKMKNIYWVKPYLDGNEIQDYNYKDHDHDRELPLHLHCRLVYWIRNYNDARKKCTRIAHIAYSGH